MKQIPKICYLSQARNAEHSYLYQQMLKIITVEFIIKYKLLPLRDALALAFADEDKIFLQSKAYENTKEIYREETLTNQRFRYVYLSIQAKIFSLTEAEAEAAEKLSFVISVYGGTEAKPFQEKIALIKDMVSKLQSDQYAANVQVLGLTEAVAELKKRNEALDDVFSLRANEKLIRSTTDNLKKIRRVVDQSASELFKAINALYMTNELIEKNQEKATELGAVIDAVNAEIIQFSETLSRRGVGKKTKINPDDKPIIPEPTPPDQGGGEDDRPVIE